MIGIVVVQLVAAALTPASGNLTENPSFEIIADGEKVPSGWRGNTDTFSRDVTVAREGKASLKYGNANPEHYRLCRQPLPLKAGGKYRFSAQVKTDGINGDDSARQSVSSGATSRGSGWAAPIRQASRVHATGNLWRDSRPSQPTQVPALSRATCDAA